MKILYLCPDTGIDVLGRKGASIHVREMIAALHRAGHQVDLVAPRLTKPGATPASTPATVRRVPVDERIQSVKANLANFSLCHGGENSLAKDVRRILYDTELVAYLADQFTADPPDLLYLRSSLLSTAGVGLAATTGRPLVVEVNAPLGAEQQTYRAGALAELYNGTERHVLRAATAVIVVSAPLAEHVAAAGVDRSRIHVCPNGVDRQRFHPAAVSATRRRDLGIPEGIVLGFVGGLRPWHGAEALPGILHRLRADGTSAALVVAGDGPAGDAIKQAARRLGVADNVTMLGAVDHDDIADVIRCFTVALAPYAGLSHDFYFSPLKLYEYLACGVPVVASDIGQLRAGLRHGQDALLVEPGNVDAAAAACRRLLDDPVLAATLAESGVSLVRERHSWDAIAARVTAVAQGVAR